MTEKEHYNIIIDILSKLKRIFELDRNENFKNERINTTLECWIEDYTINLED